MSLIFFYIQKKLGIKKELVYTYEHYKPAIRDRKKEKKLSKRTPKNPNYKIVCIHLVKDLFELYFSE